LRRRLPFTFLRRSRVRHACGYYLANNGQDTRAIQMYLGHKNMRHTIGYTELGAGQFKGF
jgi:type 1 fimbriae regulatory protein FimB/type 1 fimbriae regulatory protein FimE